MTYVASFPKSKFALGPASWLTLLLSKGSTLNSQKAPGGYSPVPSLAGNSAMTQSRSTSLQVPGLKVTSCSELDSWPAGLLNILQRLSTLYVYVCV